MWRHGKETCVGQLFLTLRNGFGRFSYIHCFHSLPQNSTFRLGCLQIGYPGYVYEVDPYLRFNSISFRIKISCLRYVTAWCQRTWRWGLWRNPKTWKVDSGRTCSDRYFWIQFVLSQKFARPLSFHQLPQGQFRSSQVALLPFWHDGVRK